MFCPYSKKIVFWLQNMNCPHFFKAHSRLGMLNLPHKGRRLNIGVEDGSDKVLDLKFLSKFKNYSITTYNFPHPDEFKKVHQFDILSYAFKSFKDTIVSRSKKDEMRVVIGGDHSIAFSSLLATLELYNPKKVGYLQIDSHADLNKISTSPTCNFHGMWLRPIVGDFDNITISSLVKKKLPTANIMYIGNLDLDTEEIKFIGEKRIKVINSTSLKRNKTLEYKKLEAFISQYDHVHISFDIDVFNKNIVKATGVPNPCGMHLKELNPILSILKDIQSKSIDLVEVNPRKKGSKRTIEIAQNVLKKLI